MAGAEEKFGRAVPDCDDYFVAVEEGGWGGVEDACEAEVADAEGAR